MKCSHPRYLLWEIFSFYTIENKEIDLKLKESDIIEMLPDSSQLNDSQLMRDLEIENGLNFLIQTGLGIERIALEKKYFCKEISFIGLEAQFQ